MTTNEYNRPLFATSRKALAFALNYSRHRYSQPLMNKAMAELKPKEVGGSSRSSLTIPELRGLDGAGQAGFIFLHFAKLTHAQRHVLICATAEPTQACSCRSPCCSGFKLNQEWTDSVEQVCHVLQEHAEFTRQKGKRGMSTHPVMRRALVEKHFGVGRVILADLAERCNVTEATVINHRKVIELYLTETEKDGWTALDGHLSAAGLIGDV